MFSCLEHLPGPGPTFDHGGYGFVAIEFQVHRACGLFPHQAGIGSTLGIHVLVRGPHGGLTTERERQGERLVIERERMIFIIVFSLCFYPFSVFPSHKEERKSKEHTPAHQVYSYTHNTHVTPSTETQQQNAKH